MSSFRDAIILVNFITLKSIHLVPNYLSIVYSILDLSLIYLIRIVTILIFLVILQITNLLPLLINSKLRLFIFTNSNITTSFQLILLIIILINLLTPKSLSIIPNFIIA